MSANFFWTTKFCVGHLSVSVNLFPIFYHSLEMQVMLIMLSIGFTPLTTSFPFSLLIINTFFITFNRTVFLAIFDVSIVILLDVNLSLNLIHLMSILYLKQSFLKTLMVSFFIDRFQLPQGCSIFLRM